MGRFDWYDATVRAEVADVRDALLAGHPGAVWERQRAAPHGYRFGDRLVDEHGTVCDVWWGGTHAYPHVRTSSEPTMGVVEVLRAAWPRDHSVSRLDPCLEYVKPGAYDWLQGVMVAVATERNIKLKGVGDHFRERAPGRSCYAGSEKSAVMARVYDKTAERRAALGRDPVKLATVPEHWARLELQIRPQGSAAKQAAATVDPVTAMGAAAWTRELLRRVADMDLEPFEVRKVWRPSDDQRAYAAFLSQYGGLLRRMLGDHGSPAAVGCQIFHDLDEREAAERMRKGKFA